MDMILWRTAEAEENSHDLARKLTAKGKKQCERVAGWLDQRLPAFHRARVRRYAGL